VWFLFGMVIFVCWVIGLFLFNFFTFLMFLVGDEYILEFVKLIEKYVFDIMIPLIRFYSALLFP